MMTRCVSVFLLCFALACSDDDIPPPGNLDSGPVVDSAVASDVALGDAGSAGDAGNSSDAGNPGDAGTEEDAGPVPDAATNGICPPAAPFGTAVGDVAPDAMLEDCDGNPVNLHSMCGESAFWLYRFSEWCPPCQTFVREDAENFYQQFVDDGVKAVVVVAQNSRGEIASRSDCARLSEQFGLSFPVLIDPRNEMNNLGISVNAESMAFDSDMRITYGDKYDHSGIPAAVMSSLE